MMIVIVTCMNEEDQINVGARVVTTLNINFSNTRGQLTQGCKITE